VKFRRPTASDLPVRFVGHVIPPGLLQTGWKRQGTDRTKRSGPTFGRI